MEFARSSGAIESAERLCTIANGGPKERGEGVGGGRHVRELRKERAQGLFIYLNQRGGSFPWERDMARNGVSSTVMQKADEWEKKGRVWFDVVLDLYVFFSGKP